VNSSELRGKPPLLKIQTVKITGQKLHLLLFHILYELIFFSDAATELAADQLRSINALDFQRALAKMKESNHFMRMGIPQQVELD
jgi:hypothetical protein